jgi:hypothetical protein
VNRGWHDTLFGSTMYSHQLLEMPSVSPVVFWGCARTTRGDGRTCRRRLSHWWLWFSFSGTESVAEATVAGAGCRGGLVAAGSVTGVDGDRRSERDGEGDRAVERGEPSGDGESGVDVKNAALLECPEIPVDIRCYYGSLLVSKQVGLVVWWHRSRRSRQNHSPFRVPGSSAGSRNCPGGLRCCSTPRFRC